LIGFETKSVPWILLKVSTLTFFPILFGLILPRNNCELRAKMVWGSKLYVHVTEHDWQKRAIGFPVWANASQNKSLQNAFPIFKCQMKRRYKKQRTPSYYKNWCTTPLFLREFSTNQSMVPSTCSPF
jgi:hypothetical protein